MYSEDNHIDPIGLLPKVFSGEATDGERLLIEEWLLADENNKKEYDSIERLWKMSGSVSSSGDIDIENEWRKINRTIGYSRNVIWLNFLKIAASVILLAALTFVGFRISGYQSSKAPGNNISVIQPGDGSTISINAGSRIFYRNGFGTIHRNLSLKGEAYFSVANGNLPFIITAGGSTIRVTGTEFNVKAYAGTREIKVTVTSGNVRFFQTKQSQNEVMVSAGETGVFNESTEAIRKTATINPNDLSWKTGVIDFHNTPMSEVVKVLSNTYHINISVDDPVKKCTVSVRFENQELDSALNVLKSTLDLIITRKGKQVIITGKGCDKK